MKKITIGIIGILLLSFLSVKISKAQIVQELNISPAPDVVGETIGYELPYPGLLPDSPLYGIKVIRDRLVSFLISDPLRKAEFDLLQADKRINGAFYLFNSVKNNDKKILLALSTISKAENYEEEAINNIKNAKKQGINVSEVLNKASGSLTKHREIVGIMEQQSPSSFKQELTFLGGRITSLEKEVNSLNP